MIARRVGERAASALGIGQRGEFVVRASELERPGALKVFGLEEDLARRMFVELSGRENRRAMRHALQSFAGFKDVVESQHGYSYSERLIMGSG
jgi:hypothetical protein